MQVSELRVAEAAKKIGGELFGDGDGIITSVCPLDDPVPNAIAFCSQKETISVIEPEKLSSLSALIVHDSASLSTFENANIPIIKVKEPQSALVQLFHTFHPPKVRKHEISNKAEVSDSAQIGNNVYIGAFSAIGENVVIADNVTIHPHVVLYEDVTIGENTEIHSGAVVRAGCSIGRNCTIQNGVIIGADGFGYIPDGNGSLKHIPQIGVVCIADNVDIGANACVDRAALGKTRIGNHSKIDNLVQIGHNVQIGVASIVCGQAAIGGSTKLGSGVIIGGNTGIADHINIPDGVRIGGNSGVDASIEEPGDYAGFPLMKAMTWKRIRARYANLSDVLRNFKNKKK